tara:strand:+ start:11002 stop:14034 length:3033 start_codon:yes stop_codon:yes gene_type:complete
MKKITIILSLLFFSIGSLFAQLQSAYFQQEVNYKIDVRLDDTLHFLHGHETIEYKNNSHETINYIYFHLWPNAYKNYHTALAKQLLENKNSSLFTANENDLGYIDSLAFKSNGKLLEWENYLDYEDVIILYLNEPLFPGESVTISTPFRVKIPSGKISRLGHIGQSYQITQWYPKPAVFDRSGWHPMPYLNQGEFYSEYGSFDVKITLPKNYVVGATGDLVNGEEELAWLNKKVEETKAITAFNTENPWIFPKSDTVYKTLHYHQEKVHDFAWFADKRYHVLKGEVTLPHTKRKVTTWAMFTDIEPELWMNAIEYINDAAYYYSLWNGDYPYNQITAVDGSISAGGGMEYPNVTVIGSTGNKFMFEETVIHEVGHNWFYGILGSNERDHPWMDEGLNSFNENRYIETKYPNAKFYEMLGLPKKIADFFDLAHYKHKYYYYISYLLPASLNIDQPIEEKSQNYTSLNYGAIVYSKSALVFDYLKAYLGDSLFDHCMQTYFEKWKFKHPLPKDLREIFEKETQQDLSWFFDDILKTTGKIDLKIIKTKPDTANPNNILVKVKNKGDIKGIPFSVSAVKNDSVVATRWYMPNDEQVYFSFPNVDYDKLEIDATDEIPEIKQNNNQLNAKGLFKKTEPLKLQFLFSLQNKNKTQLFFTPLLGWNNYDKFMPGIAFYNASIPFKKFEYIVSPMYGTGSGKLNGYANFYYHYYPKSLFHEIELGIKNAKFTYGNNPVTTSYIKNAPFVRLHFKKSYPRSHSKAYLQYRFININEEQPVFFTLQNNDGSSTSFYDKNTINYQINELGIYLKNNDLLSPYSASAVFQYNPDFLRLNATANFKFAYRKPGNGLNIRFFVGTFIFNNNANPRFNFGLAGNTDYTYDLVYLGRTETSGILNQQFYVNDGGFKNPVSVAGGNKWLTALNIESSTPIKLIGLYGDVGLVANEIRNNDGDLVDDVSSPVYDAGVSLNLIPKMFQIYFPVIISSDLNQLSYAEKIRFTLNIGLIKPIELLRNQFN